MNNSSMSSIQANLVDIANHQIYPARIEHKNGCITRIEKTHKADNFILPGFVDSHIHIESSMLVPSEFARLAVVHGTVATVSDPHEIGNVLGVPGVDFMIGNGQTVPLKFFFGAPSCVPATPFETAGARIDSKDIDNLLSRDEIKYLAEMMNWPGVLNGDQEVNEKIKSAKKYGKPVDGHAPGLTNDQATNYIDAGITTDHECVSYAEALHKINNGMKISIREGSAARNFEALAPLIDKFPGMVMLCSDDKHPDELVTGHINKLVARAVAKGCDIFNVLQAACCTPVSHYDLNVGQLQVGDPADFILVEDLENYKVHQTYIDGILVAENEDTLIKRQPVKILNNFNIQKISSDSLRVKAKGNALRVIEAMDGQLITNEILGSCTTNQQYIESDIDKDLLKLVVVNRYNDAPPSVAFIKNFNLREGAIASSVGHDSHNITAVGTDDESLTQAINLIIEARGGVSAVGFGEEHLVKLPVAGLMSDEDGYDVADRYTAIDTFAKKLGSKMRAPFMTLSFMALLVIPDLKLSDKGLFSGTKFEFVDLFD